MTAPVSIEPVANLLGRADECAVLDGLIVDIREGRSRSLVLRGEAGMGKTTLLGHLVESASDLTVARVVGRESEMELAFAGLHQLSGRMLDRLPRLPTPQRHALEIISGLSSGPAPDRFLAGLGVLGLMAEVAAERPLLCVVDDAQWLDRASALTLAFVARRLPAEPVGIVFAARGPEPELDHIDGLEVHGLRNGDARRLLERGAGTNLDERVRDRVIAESQGNPLALLELPRGSTAAELAGGFGIPGARGLPERIRTSFVRQVAVLSEDARRLVLLAAAEPVGDPLLLWRAADQLQIAPVAFEEVQAHALLTVEERVRFRHPLARSAVYRCAVVQERRQMHLALANATDGDIDPDRRAWHLAAAADGPDEGVAAELQRCAGRAQARGGLAAAAAFLQRSVALTEDPVWRAERALVAAQASLQAGAFDEALGLLAATEAGPIEELQRARVDLLRAEAAFASKRGSAAPDMLIRAAQRIEPMNAQLARAGYLEALSAALFAARFAGPGGGVRDVASAVQAAPSARGALTVAGLLLEGWATLFADGCAAAAPRLREVLGRFEHLTADTENLHLLWLLTITAPVVWDETRWDTLSRLHVELARSSGASSELPLALNSRSYVHLFRGELEAAAALIDEARVTIEATHAGLTPWGAVALVALRGRDHDAAGMLDMAAADATQRGEGIGLTVIAWARAILHNGLGLHDRAFAAAQEAIDCPTNSAASAWAMPECIEAATRVGEPDAGRVVAGRFSEIARAAGTDWARGVSARSCALLERGATAEELYREALSRLGRGRMRLDLTRAHLLYGEWLQREHRRPEARAQLRLAHDGFTSMGVEAFAERARKALLATGEHVSRRTLDPRQELTAQERQIARLACDGSSNPEIGRRLFLSPRTVEWHLHKVFTKLGIRSRSQLSGALSRCESELSVA